MVKLKDITAIVYRNLPEDGYLESYELCQQIGDKIIKEQIIPGQFGYPDMYIRHLSVTYRNRTIPIISYTNCELTMEKRIEIFAQSIKLLNENFGN